MMWRLMSISPTSLSGRLVPTDQLFVNDTIIVLHHTAKADSIGDNHIRLDQHIHATSEDTIIAGHRTGVNVR